MSNSCRCKGRGTFLYGSTSTWRGGIGGCAMTQDVCDTCWGSGRDYSPRVNIREMSRRLHEIRACKRYDIGIVSGTLPVPLEMDEGIWIKYSDILDILESEEESTDA